MATPKNSLEEHRPIQKRFSRRTSMSTLLASGCRSNNPVGGFDSLWYAAAWTAPFPFPLPNQRLDVDRTRAATTKASTPCLVGFGPHHRLGIRWRHIEAWESSGAVAWHLFGVKQAIRRRWQHSSLRGPQLAIGRGVVRFARNNFLTGDISTRDRYIWVNLTRRSRQPHQYRYVENRIPRPALTCLRDFPGSSTRTLSLISGSRWLGTLVGRVTHFLPGSALLLLLLLWSAPCCC